MFNLFQQIFGQGNAALEEAIKEGAFLVDVRTPSEFSQGSVKGALNIPLDALNRNLDKFKNKKNIVVFCRSGARSGQAKSILESNGFSGVINGGPWTAVNQIISQK